jgi:GT2 family glycosyltransferase
MTTPMITVGIIARDCIPELQRLVDALLRIAGPAEREIVVAVERPGLDVPVEHGDERGVRWIDLPAHRGIGYNRNRVLEAARGEVLLGIDDDCEPDERWLVDLLEALDDPAVDAAVGSIRIPPAGFVGDSISALGFPAGGGAGYEKMFRVDPDGTTDNIAAGNCALRTSVLREIGGFDESMTWGGEDTELAHRLNIAGKRIRYVPTAEITHPARTSLKAFGRWLYVRGRAKRQFSRKVPVGGYISHRLGTYGRILADNATDPKIVLIAPLLAWSLVLQQAGFIAETVSPTPAPAPTPQSAAARTPDSD